MSLSIEQVLDLSHRLQSWRPDEVTLEMLAEIQLPFCHSCADWHETTDVCSLTDNER